MLKAENMETKMKIPKKSFFRNSKPTKRSCLRHGFSKLCNLERPTPVVESCLKFSKWSNGEINFVNCLLEWSHTWKSSVAFHPANRWPTAKKIKQLLTLAVKLHLCKHWKNQNQKPKTTTRKICINKSNFEKLVEKIGVNAPVLKFIGSFDTES